MDRPLGLLAGEGIFPLLVAQGARAAGRQVVCVGFAGAAWPELRRLCDVYASISLMRANAWISFLPRHGVSEAIMVGRVSKIAAHDPTELLRYIPDLRMARVAWTVFRHDKRPQVFLDAATRELARDGVTLIDSTTYCPEHLATPGVMTRRQPTAEQWDDVRFGFDRCQTLSQLDIGQAIAVSKRDVIAVEALEGTNAMIERAGKVGRTSGWTLIKVANTHQDMRLDVPTIGTTTIEKLAAARAGCVVLEPGKTIILEKPKVLELADRYKIAIVGYVADAAAGAGAGQ
ncbi:MAG TPA: UDP-2,3-diacylglucosamine diphosphatase LpxI [Tepidisphaeraceae bacterium]|nr:UDP-2,3-diacylglucosamine diphosphatase LpxI [Tepidisphaeraceae bacterium]